MRQIRKMSNLVAEELQNALNEQGVTLNEGAFEAKVSEIVSSIYEAVEDTEEVEEEEDEELTEEFIKENSTFYYVTTDGTVAGEDVAEGEYVEVEETEDGIIVSVYDEDGNLKVSDIVTTSDEIADFLETAEIIEDDEVEEAPVKKFKIKNGKKVKLTKNQLVKQKLKARGKAKKGYKVVNGKQVKMSADEKRARKMVGKKLARKGKAKRKKSMKKAMKLAAGAQSGTVSESFDITSNGMTFTVLEGDEIRLNNGTITVIREGSVVFSGLEVSEGFMQRCVDESVIVLEKCNEEDDDTSDDEDEKEVEEGCKGKKKCNEEDEEECDEEDDEEEEVEESAVLTFNSKKGYVLTCEGRELPMGNRVRARATLISEGYNVTSAQLDKASAGEIVTL